MNKSVVNPFFLLRIVSIYLSDVNRLWHIDFDKLKKYQDKSFSNVVKYAYTVPMYYKKYKEHGIHPRDITKIDDIKKLPLISKDDLRKNYPDNIVPNGFNKNQGFRISTSGSTGKPVFVYYDIFSAIKSLMAFVRELKAYGGIWNKSKVAMVVDTSVGSFENAIFKSSASPFIKKFISLNNIKFIDIGEKPEDVIKKVDEFKPDFLGSDPNMLLKLSYLKNHGFGKNIKPIHVFSGGAMLDGYTRSYVENAFGTKVFDTYGTTEAGPIAFECIKSGYYHVHSDFVYLEVLDKEGQDVGYDESGKIVTTKLFIGGTPIIRYTGFDDFVKIVDKKTSCGINSQIIKQIEGRYTDLFVLPDGHILSPLTVTGIPAKIMDDFQTYKIKQFQIIQNKIDEIEILVVIDERLRNVGPSVKNILNELKVRFSKNIGHGVNILVHEVDSIEKEGSQEYFKVVISKVKPKLN